jgi:hypothetical protein
MPNYLNEKPVFNFQNQNFKEGATMENTRFISVSDLTRNPSEIFDDLNIRSKTIMRNNRPIGHLIPVDSPLSNLLDVLPDKDDVDLLELAFRRLEKPWEQHFMNMYSVKQTRGVHSIDRLIGVEDKDLMQQLPGCDHYTLWEKDGVPALFTMQVYTMHMDTHAALRDFCVKHGLVYRTDRRSWHLPGVSTLIIIEKKKER